MRYLDHRAALGRSSHTLSPPPTGSRLEKPSSHRRTRAALGRSSPTLSPHSHRLPHEKPSSLSAARRKLFFDGKMPVLHFLSGKRNMHVMITSPIDSYKIYDWASCRLHAQRWFNQRCDELVRPLIYPTPAVQRYSWEKWQKGQVITSNKPQSFVGPSCMDISICSSSSRAPPAWQSAWISSLRLESVLMWGKGMNLHSQWMLIG